VTATPSDWPTWRLVEAIPDATPAWVTGMPDTAAYVIGAFTMPAPMPKTANAARIWTVDEESVSRDSRTPAAASPAPEASIGSRAPRRARIRPESTAPGAMMAAIGSMCRPA
jgi:hypothetical protein